MIKIDRSELKAFYRIRDSMRSHIQAETIKYIRALGPDQKGIYISDHAIVRYLERVKGKIFDKAMTDTQIMERLSYMEGYVGDIRDEMISIQEDRDILKSQKSFFRKDGFGYIIKELAVVTVIKI